MEYTELELILRIVMQRQKHLKLSFEVGTWMTCPFFRQRVYTEGWKKPLHKLADKFVI